MHETITTKRNFLRVRLVRVGRNGCVAASPQNREQNAGKTDNEHSHHCDLTLVRETVEKRKYVAAISCRQEGQNREADRTAQRECEQELLDRILGGARGHHERN